MKTKWKSLAIFVSIALAVGGLSALFSMSGMEMYKTLKKPTLSPPEILFPIVWTILFVLMGTASYRIFETDCQNRELGLIIYFIQLAVNFFWPILFFNLQAFFGAFLWLILLWILIFATIKEFYKCDKVSAFLLVPYILWVTFAGYLNFMVYLLN